MSKVRPYLGLRGRVEGICYGSVFQDRVQHKGKSPRGRWSHCHDLTAITITSRHRPFPVRLQENSTRQFPSPDPTALSWLAVSQVPQSLGPHPEKEQQQTEEGPWALSDWQEYLITDVLENQQPIVMGRSQPLLGYYYFSTAYERRAPFWPAPRVDSLHPPWALHWGVIPSAPTTYFHSQQEEKGSFGRLSHQVGALWHLLPHSFFQLPPKYNSAWRTKLCQPPSSAASLAIILWT